MRYDHRDSCFWPLQRRYFGAIARYLKHWFTTGNPAFAECQGLCRVPNLGHSATSFFAECLAWGTRQNRGTRQRKALGKYASLPSAESQALGKEISLPCALLWHSAKLFFFTLFDLIFFLCYTYNIRCTISKFGVFPSSFHIF